MPDADGGFGPDTVDPDAGDANQGNNTDSPSLDSRIPSGVLATLGESPEWVRISWTPVPGAIGFEIVRD